MPRLTWNGSGERFYETGVDRGVLYVGEDQGVAWTGLTSIAEKPSGGSPTPYYLDGVKYLNVPSSEEFEATISAFTYPDEFVRCEGTSEIHSGLFIMQQQRVPFGLSYRTKIGNDLAGSEYGYKIHIIYNALATPAQRTFNSLSESTDPSDFSWDITTRPPLNAASYKRTAHVVIDSRSTNAGTMAAVEDILYGSDTDTARIPSLDDLLVVFEVNSILIVTDNGDGTFTVTGPDEAILMLDSDTFQITWPSAIVIDADSYTISSL